MPWTRRGRKGAFRYFDQRGRPIRDAATLERIETLAIPPAWKEVRISPSPKAKLQATGLDNAGRKQYLYHADFRAAQEQAKYDKLIRFAEKLPELREAMAEHLDKGELDRGRLQPDEQAAQRLREALPGPEFSAKDFRTWGGTLLAGIALAEYAKRKGFPETKIDEKRSISAAMRRVAQLGNTPAVCRASYVSPAVIEQYLDGRTIEDYRPRHLRAVGARETGLDQEEQALLSLLRSWRIRQAQVPRDFSAHFR